MVRRIAIRLAALFAIGLMLTVAIAWACAIWVSPDPSHDGLDPAQLSGFRREFFERIGPDPGGNDPGTLFVTCAHVRPGAIFLDVAVEDEDLGRDVFRGPLPHVGVTRAGWPLSCVESLWHHDASRSRVRILPRREWGIEFPNTYVSGNRLFIPRVLPFGPMWTGLAVNVAFWMFVAACAWYGPRAIVWHSRRRQGRCVACGYLIGVSPLCSECGRAVNPRATCR